jgi:hypothetical protein
LPAKPNFKPQPENIANVCVGNKGKTKPKESFHPSCPRRGAILKNNVACGFSKSWRVATWVNVIFGNSLLSARPILERDRPLASY